MDIFFFWGGGGLSQNWTNFRGHFYALHGLFLRSRYRIWVSLGVAKMSNMFWPLDIPGIFKGER